MERLFRECDSELNLQRKAHVSQRREREEEHSRASWQGTGTSGGREAESGTLGTHDCLVDRAGA